MENGHAMQYNQEKSRYSGDGKKAMKENGKYRIIQSCYWMMMNVSFGYATFYLGGFGYSAGEVGMLTAIFSGVSAVCQPMLGRVADKSRRFNWKVILMLLSAVCCLDMILLSIFKSKVLVGCLFGLMALFLNCMMPMINAACFYYEKRGVHVDFGIARGMGSMFYAVVSMLLGWMTVRMGTSAIPVTGIPILAVLFLTTCLMPCESVKATKSNAADQRNTNDENTADGKDLKGRKEERSAGADNAANRRQNRAQKTESGFLKKYPAFMVMLLGSTLLMAAHTFMTTYLLQILEQIGGNTSHLGTALAIGAVTEVPILFLFSHIIKRCSSSRLLVISGFFYIVKSTMLLFAGSIGLVYVAHLLQPVSYALYASAIVYFTDESMREEDKVTGQSMMTMTSAIGSVVGNLVGGWLIDFGGVTVMMVFCAVLAVAAASVVAVSAVMHGKVLNKKL